MIDLNKINESLPEKSVAIVLIKDKKDSQELNFATGDLYTQHELLGSYLYATIQNAAEQRKESIEEAEKRVLDKLHKEFEISKMREVTVKKMTDAGTSENEARAILKWVEEKAREDFNKIDDDDEMEELYEAFKN